MDSRVMMWKSLAGGQSSCLQRFWPFFHLFLPGVHTLRNNAFSWAPAQSIAFPKGLKDKTGLPLGTPYWCMARLSHFLQQRRDRLDSFSLRVQSLRAGAAQPGLERVTESSRHV